MWEAEEENAEMKDCTMWGDGCACSSENITSSMDRRRFLTVSACAAAAAALAACAVTDNTTGPSSLSGTVKVSDFAALNTIGGVATTTVNGTPIAIVRTATSTFIALSR